MAEKPYHKFSELGDWFACLRKLETWLILGMPDGGDNLDGMRRVFLPSHGFAVCWRFWVEADITLYVDEFKVDDDAKRFVFPYTCDQIKIDAGHSDMALFVCQVRIHLVLVPCLCPPFLIWLLNVYFLMTCKTM